MKFPRAEQFGLTAQLRRAVVSSASNIVEGCARTSTAEYLRFLDMAFGSVREVECQLSLAHRLDYLSVTEYEPLRQEANQASRTICALIRSYRKA